jgi:hypothetical protein
MRRLLLAVVLLASVLVTAAGQRAAADDVAGTEPTDAQILRRIAHWQKETWHWQTVLGKRRTPATDGVRDVADRENRLRVLLLWRRHAGRVWLQAKHPPHRRQWLCIHRYEGPWRSYPGGPGLLDSGGPYYGGLQMDLEFQRTYGAYLLRTKGTADRWAPLEQMWVAERAHRDRGFYPWPTTARYCGLI